MKNKKTTKQPEKETLHLHPDLTGFEIGINSLGEIVSNYDIDKLNSFLNKHVADKKLKDRELDKPQE
jgi:hypothetical protein